MEGTHLISDSASLKNYRSHLCGFEHGANFHWGML